jgi:protein ImuA
MELRRLLPGSVGELRKTLPFGLAAIDSHLPQGGLAAGALHEVVPQAEGAIAAALGFIAAVMARLLGARPLIFVMPPYGLRRCGRPHGHGLSTLGLDPRRLILVDTAHRKEALWAMEEALRSAAPQAVAGVIDKLDLKTSQRLHLAATDAGLPLLLLRPAQTLEASAAATRWRVGTAEAARDRFGLFAQPRWHLSLERVRNGRPGEWVVEYDHVAHRFSLAAALADSAHARGARENSEKSVARNDRRA